MEPGAKCGTSPHRAHERLKMQPQGLGASSHGAHGGTCGRRTHRRSEPLTTLAESPSSVTPQSLTVPTKEEQHSSLGSRQAGRKLPAETTTFQKLDGDTRSHAWNVRVS